MEINTSARSHSKILMDILQTIILDIEREHPKNRSEFLFVLQEAIRRHRVSPPPTRDLLVAYQTLVQNKTITSSTLLETFLRKAQVRSGSGIAIITSLLKPYSCPAECVFCPTEYRMPKSYVASEPAAARSLRLNFDPYLLMRGRIETLEQNGHPCGKIEYITKGGTWNAYPLKYQYWYMLESFRACNEMSLKHAPRGLNIKTLKQNARTTEEYWNNKPLEALQEALEIEQRKNEKAKHRIIGVTFETRPDAIAPKTIYHMRRQGCTRVELGLQAPDDRILTLVKRGHTVQQFCDAMVLLRQAGFKVDLHFMPDLPGTTPDHDVAMYKQLFADERLRPDMVKIYPNVVLPSTELYQWLLDGRYTPYGEQELFNALLHMKLATPRYCRISRLIRDIPSQEIAAGNKITNLREALEKELKKQGKRCICLRCREIGRQKDELAMRQLGESSNRQIVQSPKLFIETYETVGGTEYFLSYEDPKRIAVSAFLRLRIPDAVETRLIASLHDYLPEIRDCAFIRELHTYGQMVEIGKQDDAASQHKGLGKRLMAEAERIAREHEFKKIAVISGVGVRGYYRKLGYRKQGTYMVKKLTDE
ncbi:MAG: tRNA uridine(34) 5-carboxymethylaminomethyl modification radical SAM/GNAT enzyme Elp3 [Patescibacteria group bacterium]